MFCPVPNRDLVLYNVIFVVNKLPYFKVSVDKDNS